MILHNNVPERTRNIEKISDVNGNRRYPIRELRMEQRNVIRK